MHQHARARESGGVGLRPPPRAWASCTQLSESSTTSGGGAAEKAGLKSKIGHLLLRPDGAAKRTI